MILFASVAMRIRLVTCLSPLWPSEWQNNHRDHITIVVMQDRNKMTTLFDECKE